MFEESEGVGGDVKPRCRDTDSRGAVRIELFFGETRVVTGQEKERAWRRSFLKHCLLGIHGRRPFSLASCVTILPKRCDFSRVDDSICETPSEEVDLGVMWSKLFSM